MAWLTLDVPDTTLPAGTYWLAFSFSDSAQKYYYVSSYTGAGERNRSNNASQNGFTNPWGSSANSYSGARSIYATYELAP